MKTCAAFLSAISKRTPATGDPPVRGYLIGGPLYETEGSQSDPEDLRRLAEGDDVHAEKALRYLDAALTQGTTLAAARHPLRSFARR